MGSGSVQAPCTCGGSSISRSILQWSFKLTGAPQEPHQQKQPEIWAKSLHLLGAVAQPPSRVVLLLLLVELTGSSSPTRGRNIADFLLLRSSLDSASGVSLAHCLLQALPPTLPTSHQLLHGERRSCFLPHVGTLTLLMHHHSPAQPDQDCFSSVSDN